MSPETLLAFLAVMNSATNSGLTLLDVRGELFFLLFLFGVWIQKEKKKKKIGNRELLNLPQNKKFGPSLEKALETCYLKVEFDKKIK